VGCIERESKIPQAASEAFSPEKAPALNPIPRILFLWEAEAAGECGYISITAPSSSDCSATSPFGDLKPCRHLSISTGHNIVHPILRLMHQRMITSSESRMFPLSAAALELLARFVVLESHGFVVLQSKTFTNHSAYFLQCNGARPKCSLCEAVSADCTYESAVATSHIIDKSYVIVFS
jgi:Fungal Zn(2)-Cys(6) binuclear cluster domain